MNRFAGGLYPENYTFKYPKAGEQNSVVELYCCDVAGREYGTDGYGGADRPVHPSSVLDPDGAVGLLSAEPSAEPFRSVVVRFVGSVPRRVRRAQRPLCRTGGRADRDFPSRRRPLRRPQRAGRIHASLLIRRFGRAARPDHVGRVGSDRAARHRGRPGRSSLHRDVAAAARPVYRPARRPRQAAADRRRRDVPDRPFARIPLFYQLFLERADAQPGDAAPLGRAFGAYAGGQCGAAGQARRVAGARQGVFPVRHFRRSGTRTVTWSARTASTRRAGIRC